MSIDLQTFASGDTDYISKMNANVASLIEAINALQTQVSAVSGGDALSVGMLMGSLFNFADALIGPNSYKATLSASTLTLATGGAYLQNAGSVVASLNSVPISFGGQPSGTYYIMVDTTGQPSRQTSQLPGSIYSVVWTGTAFGVVTYLVPIFFDAVESDASRKSTALAHTYSTLDGRLEASELLAKSAQQDADSALSIAYELQYAIGVSYRKVGITVDGTTGVKGAIQIDFDGTIIGWSCIADAVGNLQVDVDRKASSAPPSAPAIPNTTTDKISGSAPIALATAQSAARAAAGVSSWNTHLSKWDVLQFNVTNVTTLTKATLYILIQEDLPSPPDVINPLEEFEESSPPENLLELFPPVDFRGVPEVR